MPEPSPPEHNHHASPGRKIRSVTVYCSSSSFLDEAYYELSREVGRQLGSGGYELVYGGGRLGMMGQVAKSSREAGGRVVGIITDRLREAEQMDDENAENIVVGTMRERKAQLEDRGDAIAVLPGGMGTLEEFFEILVGRLVGEHDKPILLLNPPSPLDGEGFWDPLLHLFAHMTEEKFMKAGAIQLFNVCDSPECLMGTLGHWERNGSDLGVDRLTLMPGLPGGLVDESEDPEQTGRGLHGGGV